VRFWDASAIVPLLVAEPSTRRLQALAAKDSAMLVWWGSEVLDDRLGTAARKEGFVVIDIAPAQ
jgi:hypothetical protein